MPGEIHDVTKTDSVKIILEYVDDQAAEVMLGGLRDVLPSHVLHSNTRWANELRTKYKITHPVNFRGDLERRYGLVINDVELLNAFNSVRSLVDARVITRVEEEADPLFSLEEVALIAIIYKEDTEGLIRFIKGQGLSAVARNVSDSLFNFSSFLGPYLNFLRRADTQVALERLTPQGRLQLRERSVPYYAAPASALTTTLSTRDKIFLLVMGLLGLALGVFVVAGGPLMFLNVVFYVLHNNVLPLFLQRACWYFFLALHTVLFTSLSFILLRLKQYWNRDKEIHIEEANVGLSLAVENDNRLLLARVRQIYKQKIHNNLREAQDYFQRNRRKLDLLFWGTSFEFIFFDLTIVAINTLIYPVFWVGLFIYIFPIIGGLFALLPGLFRYVINKKVQRSAELLNEATAEVIRVENEIREEYRLQLVSVLQAREAMALAEVEVVDERDEKLNGEEIELQSLGTFSVGSSRYLSFHHDSKEDEESSSEESNDENEMLNSETSESAPLLST